MPAGSPAKATPHSFRDLEARAADGTRLWVRRYDAPEGSGAPLVLSNGACCSTHYWPLLVEHFAGRLPLVLWDYRGHGRSERAPLETHEIPAFAADLVAVLDAIGAERASLVGHSMGVQVILEAYRRAPARVAALVPMFGTFGDVVSTISRLPGAAAAIDRALAALERRADLAGALVQPALGTAPSILLARLAGSNWSLCPPSYLAALMAHIKTMDAAAVVRTFRSVIRHNAWDVLPRIEAPALIFAGAADRMTPVALAERMARAMPDAELAVVDHGSHLAMLENPGFVHCRLELFLRDRRLMAEPESKIRQMSPPRTSGAVPKSARA